MQILPQALLFEMSVAGGRYTVLLRSVDPPIHALFLTWKGRSRLATTTRCCCGVMVVPWHVGAMASNRRTVLLLSDGHAVACGSNDDDRAPFLSWKVI